MNCGKLDRKISTAGGLPIEIEKFEIKRCWLSSTPNADLKVRLLQGHKMC